MLSRVVYHLGVIFRNAPDKSWMQTRIYLTRPLNLPCVQILLFMVELHPHGRTIELFVVPAGDPRMLPYKRSLAANKKE